MKIEWIDYVLPKTIVSNDYIDKEHPDWNVHKAEERTGVKNRHWLESDEIMEELACKIIRKHKDIPDIILYCTQTPFLGIPGDAYLLHDDMGYADDVKVFDISSACSGFIGLLYLAQAFDDLEGDMPERIFLVTAEAYSQRMGWTDNQRESRLLFGDGVAVTCLNTEFMDSSISPIILKTDGQGFYKFYSDGTGLLMDGKGILEFVMQRVPPLVNEILSESGLTKDDIDLFVFHQASKVTLDFLNKKLKIPPEKQFTNIENIGNTVSASIPIALRDAELQGRLKHGMKVLIAGFGSGLSWGGCIIDW